MYNLQAQPISLAAIVPPKWYNTFLLQRPLYQLTLAPWLINNPDYVRKLKSRIKPSQLVVDNGAFEGDQVSTEVLMQLASEVSASTIVLPDEFGNAHETLKKSWAALGAVRTRSVMFAPHGRSVEEWKHCLDAWIAKWKASSFSNELQLVIGVNSPRKEDSLEPAYGGRVECLKHATTYPYTKHLLGLAYIDQFAYKTLDLARRLDSRVLGMDTSVPFALGADGQLLTPEARKVPLGDIAHYDRLSTKQKRLIHLNIAILETWCATGVADYLPGFVIRQTASRWMQFWQVGFADLGKVCESVLPKGRYLIHQEGIVEEIRTLGKEEEPELEIFETVLKI